MIKIRNVILSIFVSLLLMSCQTVYNFTAEPIKKSEDELKIGLLLETIKPNIMINFLLNSDAPITDFELINWYFQIGDKIIEFDPNNMKFEGTENETRYFVTLYENGKYDIEKISEWNKKYQNKYDVKPDDFQFNFWMTRYVDKQLADEIREKNISSLKVYLEYSFMVNNQIYYHIIDEDFIIKIEKKYFTIFDIIAFGLSGG